MATTTFTNNVTLTDADWFNDVDRVVYDILNDPADAAAVRVSLGLVIGTNVQAYDADLTTWAGVTPGTGVATALAVNVGSAGAFVTFNGALGTPSSGTVTNLTGTASININGTVGATTPAAGAFTTVSATDTSGATQITGRYSASAYSFLGHNNTNGYCGTFTNHPFILRVNNTDVATLSSTGLEVTGALSCSTNLTVTGSTITTGSTTALSLATSGGTQGQFVNVASAVNRFQFYGAVSGGSPSIYAAGSDTNVSMALQTKGSGVFSFQTSDGGAEQVRINHTASANRYITLTGSNGGNPTIGTSAGNLAISSAIVLPASTTSVASANLPHGSAPTSPVDGDMWTTTAGLYVRINGVTVGPLS